MNTLKAETRTMDTKAKRLRREGYVTGNVFGREIEGSRPVKIERSNVEKLLKTSNKGSQIMLDVDGQSYDVLIKEIQFNPLKGQVDEIDFQALVSNEKVHSVAEVVLVNHDKLAAGVLQQHLEEISFKALPSALVDKVMVDVGDMKIGDVIKVRCQMGFTEYSGPSDIHQNYRIIAACPSARFCCGIFRAECSLDTIILIFIIYCNRCFA